MIEGLKVTLPGTELAELCNKRALYHRQRAQVYASQAANMVDSQIEPMAYTNGDPRRALTDKRTEHESYAGEMEFIAAHLVLNEEYLLDAAALNKLGISKGGFY